MNRRERKKKPTGRKVKEARFTAKVFRECVQNLEEVSLMQPKDRQPLPPGWTWAIYYQDRDPGRPTLAAQILTMEYDCFVYISADLGPGLFALRISTGMAPAEVVAAVLKANRLL